MSILRFLNLLMRLISCRVARLVAYRPSMILGATLLPVDTERAAGLYRAKTLESAGQRILMTRLQGSGQEVDLHDPVNCQGFGRVRHFRRATSLGWPPNPLPIDPAAR